MNYPLVETAVDQGLGPAPESFSQRYEYPLCVPTARRARRNSSSCTSRPAEVRRHVETHTVGLRLAAVINARLRLHTRERARCRKSTFTPFKGRTQEQKAGAGERYYRCGREEFFNAPADAVVVSIIETEGDVQSKGGVLFSEMKR